MAKATNTEYRKLSSKHVIYLIVLLSPYLNAIIAHIAYGLTVDTCDSVVIKDSTLLIDSAPGEIRNMYVQIDIYQCSSDHIHLVLGGLAEGEAIFNDFEVFTKFTELCHEFAQRHVPIPKAFLDALDEGANN